MSDKEKWLDGELWNFVRGAAIDLEIPLKSPAEEQLYWHMKQACGVYANVPAVECRAPAPQPAGEHVCQTPNYTDGPCYACAKDMLMEWVFERYENCVRISDGKTGEDRAEWLKDADHFMLILSFLRGAATPQVTPTECEFLRQQVERLEKRIAAHDYPEENTRMGCNNLATPQVTPHFPDCNVGTSHECCVARMKRLEKEQYGQIWEGTSEQASPTPKVCPTCGSDKAELRLCEDRPYSLAGRHGAPHAVGAYPGCTPCTDPWHSSAGTPKGTTKD